MAKVADIKFNFKGQDIKAGINCNSSGEFNVYLPDEVAQALDIDKNVKGTTLRDVEKTFFDALNRYKESETIEQLFIAIEYGASGKFSYNSEGRAMFSSRDKFDINISFRGSFSAIGFDFVVVMKITTDGVEKWYNTTQGKDRPHWDNVPSEDMHKYFKSTEFWDIEKYTIIPFSEAALSTLLTGREQLRKVSEMLHTFITQDEEQILLQLTNNKLLS